MPEATSKYELPLRAHHPSDDQHPGPDVENELFTLGDVEQRLRVDFITHGGDNVLEYVERTIERQRTFEQDHVFTNDPLGQRLKHADPFLEDQLQSSRSDDDIEMNRRNWYDNMYDNISSRLESATESIGWKVNQQGDETGFEVYTITDGTGDTGQYSHSNILGHDQFSGITDFDSAGFTYPLEAVVCQSSSGSKYAYLPWYGTIICTCQDKINEWRVPICKHEIAALLKGSKGMFDFEESIDPRFRRLCSRDAMLSHTPER